MSELPSPIDPQDNGHESHPHHGDLDSESKHDEEYQLDALRSSIANISGGVNIDAGNDVNIGGDVVGRDRITNIANITNQYTIQLFDGAQEKLGSRDAIMSTNQEDPRPPTLRVPKPSALPEPRVFRDRNNESATLNEMILQGKQALIVYGPDGVGKSALLRKAANSDAAGALPNGVVTIEGIDSSGKALSLDDIAQRVFVTLYDSSQKVDASSARTYLAKTLPLVILDGVAMSHDMLNGLRGLFPNSPILIALSEPLLESSEPRRIKLNGLPHDEAIDLLAAISERQVDKANRALFDDICTLLADAPQAIVTVANFMKERQFTPSTTLEILNGIRPESGEPIQMGISRAQNLAKSNLGDPELLVWRTVAALPGKSVDPNMLAAILSRIAGNLISYWNAAIENLKKVGLLHANSPRLRIDPGFRPLILADADEAIVQEQLIVELRHAAEQKKMHDWHYCEDELGNILGAIQWATEHARWSDVIELGRAIEPYVALNGLWDAWSTTLTQIMQAAHAIDDDPVEAWALHQLGSRALAIGQTALANKYLYQALALRRAMGDKNGLVHTRHNLDIMTHGARWAGQDLTGYNFTSADLAQADLRSADLQGVSLEEANLAGAILRAAKLQKANLASAYLGKADLRRANLQDADLTNAYVTNVDLRETDLTNVDLSRANLRGAQITEEQLRTIKSLSGAIMPNGRIHP